MKKRRIFLLAFVSLIVLAVVWAMGMRFYYQHQFNQRVAELRTQGFPVSLADLEKTYVLPEGVPNAADVYLEAFANLQEPTEEENEWLPVSGKYISPDDVPPFPPQVMNALESYLARNQKTLDLLDEAAKIEHCLWPRKLDEAYFSVDRYKPIKNVGQLLCERNLYLAQQDKKQELLSSIRTIDALAEAMLMQPFFTDYAVSTALIGMLANNNLNVAMSLTSLKEPQLGQLQSAINRMHNRNGFYHMLVNERCALIGGDLRFNWGYHLDKSQSGAAATVVQICYSLFPTEPRDRLLAIDYFGQFIEGCSLAPYLRRCIFEKAAQEIKVHSGLHFSDVQSAITLWRIQQRMSSNLYCAETAVAVERYRLKYNNLPETLEAIVPEFMADMPRDPFDNEPLRYIRHDVGYTVYTIGDDCVDNGGLSMEEARKQNGDQKPEQYDWPFRVRK